MKKTIIATLAATITLGATVPAFAHTQYDIHGHYLSDYLQNVVNTVYDATTKAIADIPDEIVFDLGYEVIEGGSDYE